MSEYDSFRSFMKAVYSRLNGEFDGDFSLDEKSINKTDSLQAGFQRDDTYRFIVARPHDEMWPPTKLFVYLPNETGRIADRPNIPIKETDVISVTGIVELFKQHAPEYEGEFEYQE